MADRGVVVTANAEARVVSPAGLQDLISTSVVEHPSGARPAFPLPVSPCEAVSSMPAAALGLARHLLLHALKRPWAPGLAWANGHSTTQRD